MRSAHFLIACAKPNLTIYDVIDYGPTPPPNFQELSERECDRILEAVVKQKKQVCTSSQKSEKE